MSLMRGNRGEGVREIDSVISGGISAVPTRGALAARRKHVRVANTNQGTARPTDREKSLEKWGCGSSCLSSRILNARCPKREALLQATISVGLFLAACKPKSLSHWSGAQSKPCWLGVFRVKLAPSQGGCISVWLHGKIPCGVPWPPTVLACACCRPPDSGGGLDLGYLTEASSRIRSLDTRVSRLLLCLLLLSVYATFTHTPPIQY